MPSETAPLQGAHVLVTRAQAQAGSICEQLAAHGADCVCLPMFDITPLDATPVRPLNDYQGIIFTSRNAVRHGPELPAAPPPCLAVGPATAAALTGAGVKNVAAPSRTDSEGLLDLPSLRDVENQRWLIIKGRGGRRLLGNVLAERGARVDILEVYQRRPVYHEPGMMGRILADSDAVIIYSGEGLQHLVNLCSPRARERLKQLQLVVPGLRVVKMAQELGFQHTPWPAQQMSDDALADALLAAMHDTLPGKRIKESRT